METARTWDSYEESLMVVLNHHLPKNCFEWGVGKSTSTIANHPAVETLDSVEHNPEWLDKVKSASPKVHLIFEADKDLYPLVQGRFDKYDLVFIDGLHREKCILSALDLIRTDGVVILHDAMRPKYQKPIKEYRYCFRQDDGHTVILMNDKLTADVIHKGLQDKIWSK